jgi:hypothetical protein
MLCHALMPLHALRMSIFRDFIVQHACDCFAFDFESLRSW